MTWLTWRQHRFEALGTALVVLPFLLAVIGLLIAVQPVLDQIRHACPSFGDACQIASQPYDDRFATLHQLIEAVLIGLPILPGLFIGAPLIARELEQGTEQLVWSQGITRRRWLFAKLAIVGGATLIAAIVVAVAGQASSSARPAAAYSQWHAFDIQGPEFAAYALFSLALGVAAGALIGRTVPAMAVALVGFIGTRMAIEFLARPNFLPPLVWNVGSSADGNQGDVWMIGDQRQVDLAGNAIGSDRFNQAFNSCGSVANASDALTSCLRAHGVQILQSYQPAGRFLLFQGIESAIFVIAAAGLLALTFWSVRRRA
jgi:hypothetical protein